MKQLLFLIGLFLIQGKIWIAVIMHWQAWLLGRFLAEKKRKNISKVDGMHLGKERLFIVAADIMQKHIGMHFENPGVIVSFNLFVG